MKRVYLLLLMAVIVQGSCTWEPDEENISMVIWNDSSNIVYVESATINGTFDVFASFGYDAYNVPTNTDPNDLNVIYLQSDGGEIIGSKDYTSGPEDNGDGYGLQKPSLIEMPSGIFQANFYMKYPKDHPTNPEEKIESYGEITAQFIVPGGAQIVVYFEDEEWIDEEPDGNTDRPDDPTDNALWVDVFMSNGNYILSDMTPIVASSYVVEY